MWSWRRRKLDASFFAPIEKRWKHDEMKRKREEEERKKDNDAQVRDQPSTSYAASPPPQNPPSPQPEEEESEYWEISTDEDEEEDDDITGGGGQHFESRYIELDEIQSRYVKKFGVHDHEYRFVFRKDIKSERIFAKRLTIARIVLKDIVRYTTSRIVGYKLGTDLVRLTIINHSLNNTISSDYECCDPTRSLGDKLVAILSSDETIKLEETTFWVQVIPLPSGGGKRGIFNLNEDLRLKKCIIRIQDDNENLCGLRAIVTALSYHRNEIMNVKLSSHDIINIRKGRAIQRQLATRLRDALGDEFDDAVGCTLHEITLCEDICRVRIKVVSSARQNSVIYAGNRSYDTILCLYHHSSSSNENHFDVITSLKALLGSSYYCDVCDRGYNNKNRRHVCRRNSRAKDSLCSLCMHVHDMEGKRVLCTKCNRYCKNSECLALHKDTVLCHIYYRCENCGKLEESSNRSTHICGLAKCRNCHQVVQTKTHLCHMTWIPARGGLCRCSECWCKKEVETPSCFAEWDKKNQAGKECMYKSLYGVTGELLRKNIRLNFLRLSRELHPDKNAPTADRYLFGDMVKAYNTVKEALAAREEDEYTEHDITDVVRRHRNELKLLGVEEPPATCKCTGCASNCAEHEPEYVKFKTCTYTTRYIFYDYECQQETGIHVPNLIVAANFEGDRFVFHTNEEFCEWAISRRHIGYTFIAHYARGYDSYFILNYCLNNAIVPYIITQGAKLTLLQIKKMRIRFIDSHNFVVGTPLSQFPKTFGLAEMKKGWFPHFFNTVANANYVGPMPDIKYYGCATMKPSGREEFLRWHAERVAEHYVFDLKKELLEYCTSDVDLLRSGCLKLREQFLKIANVDPFRYNTLPALCLAIYRARYLRNDSIAVNVGSYARDRYSIEAMVWLYSLPNADDIQHACNGGEEIINGAPVDGYCADTRTVYQFHGCYFHGCKLCFPDPETYNKKLDQEMGDLYQRTEDRSHALRAAGYTVVEQWECVWKRSLEYRDADRTRVQVPLDPRNAYTGGRVETFSMYKNFSGTPLKGRYVDVVSLYPTVMRYDKYPHSHPKEKIYKPKIFENEWFGLIKCKILPPVNLFIPVLPFKVKSKSALSSSVYEKLLFPLCRRCAQECSPVCTHSNPEERALTGEWTTEEVKLALEKGYEILEIYEVWDYAYTTRLFQRYIDAFMKLKLEASPFDGSKIEYMREIREKMGIELDGDKIEPNPVLRTLAKLCMNSLYGKFGQRDNTDTIVFVRELSEFYEILTNKALHVIDVLPINDDVVQIKYCRRIEEKIDDFTTSLPIAIFTTSNARIRLYREMEKIGERVLYCDTDSIIYVDDGNSYNVPIGEALGDFSNELDIDDFIVEFISTGPKSYYYKTAKGRECTKMKGFTLNHEVLERINATTMKGLIDREISIIDRGSRINRNTTTKLIENIRTKKRLIFDYNKRIIISNYNTVPYGFTRDFT